MRGEHVDSVATVTAAYVGSSPHARGTRVRPRRACRSVTGSSPHARGTRHAGTLLRSERGSSPHARGTRRLAGCDRSASVGSSPHARGTRRSAAARAGSNPVHPRMRGEHDSTVDATSPSDRFIPACAGNTLRRCAGRRRSRRFIPACAGNTAADRGDCVAATGSSPHARGTHGLHGCRRCAGAVHPRMRGEHWTRGVLRVERPTVARVSVCKRHGGDPAMRQRSEPSRWSWLSLSSLPPVALGQHGCRRTLLGPVIN